MKPKPKVLREGSIVPVKPKKKKRSQVMANYCKIFKSGDKSFRITKKLLDKAHATAKMAKKKIEIIIDIPCDENFNYRLICELKKEKR